VTSRVCRVRPDVPAVDRAFDYTVPDEFGPVVRVGTIVRVPLHGRRVRGWVVADDVAPEASRAQLRPLAAVASAGPETDVVELSAWAAWRYAGPMVVFLRAASPPNVVTAGSRPELETGVFPAAPAAVSLPTDREVGLVAWPPAADRRELIAGLLAPEGSTVVVLPDGRRVAALARELEHVGRRPVVMRADQRDAERTAAWDSARAGSCVVIGGRLAVLAPVPDLRGVIVLDEGDEALKEERAPTWNARELALERARRGGASVTLVSPAPTLEAEAVAGPAVRPTRTVERDGWPLLDVVDRRHELRAPGLLSIGLADALHRVLATGARAVCVLNRRGRARLLACAACGELARCERCGAAVAEGDHGLVCRRCGDERPRLCLECHGTRLKVLRVGVSRVRDELAALLRRATVAEVDAATADRAAAEGVTPDVLVPDVLVPDVLVGTEAVLHRAPVVPGRPVGLVAFLDFDQELLAARYRAAEQALWLLVRAARLVGGRTGGGRVLVQTRLPDHEVIGAAQAADPAPVAAAERARRRALGFPPFGGLAELSGDAGSVTTAAASLRSIAGVEVLGPVAAGAGIRALVQAPDVATLCDALEAVVPDARGHGRLRVDVDPLRV
jgi:primosomal protein N' (replication factor Y) (superfamily II helicase)